MTRMWLRFWTICLLLAASACGIDGGNESKPQVLDVSLNEAVQRGDVPLHFKLLDSGAYALQVRVEYSLNGGEWRKASPSSSAGYGSGFSANPMGVEHVFVWNSLADSGKQATSARLRVRAANPFHSALNTGPEFKLANDNSAPLAFFAGIEKREDNMVVVRLAVTDTDNDPISVNLEYSIDGGEVWREATFSGKREGLLNSESSGLHPLLWNSAADIAYADYPAVRLRVRAYDALGAGPARLSDVFSISNLVETRLETALTTATLRGTAAISFDIFGNPESRYALKIEFSTDGGETYDKCSQFISRTDKTRNLSALPQGKRHVFFWNSLSDLGEKKQRNVLLRLELLDYSGRSLEPSVVSQSEVFSVDNAPIRDLPLISEIYIGAKPGSSFVELYSAPGYNFRGMSLSEIDQSGFPTEAVFPLDGLVAPPDGFMVLAGPDGPEADLEIADFEKLFQNRRVSNLLLQKPELDYVYDAVGFGDFGDRVFMGEGSPAPYPPLGMSLQRNFSNTDMDDNAIDFVVGAPTPGSGVLWPDED